MKKNFFNKTLFLLSFVFALLSMQNLFLPKTKVVVYAQSTSIEITGTESVNLNGNIPSFQLTAEVIDSSEYSGENIIWFLNNTPISTTKFNANLKFSTLTLTKNADYLNVAPNTIWTIRAEIEEDSSISNTHIVLFKSTESAIQIHASTLTQAFSEEFDPFTLQIVNTPVKWENNKVVEWYMLRHSNAFQKVSTSTVGGNGSGLNFTPEKPGKYTFFAKIDEDYSNPITLTASFQKIDSFQISFRELDVNEQGFQTYQFSLDNLNSNQDLDGITWRWMGFNTPKQYGGKDYFFEPSAYGTYQIYAEHKAEGLYSKTETLEIRIDRTGEILKYGAIALGVMIVGLIFIIKRNIKKDKIW